MTTELTLQMKNVDGRSVIADCYFTSPLKIGTPRSEGERANIVLMMASAGVLKGDSFCYDIVCGPQTSVTLTEQSYTKIFNTGEDGARKKLTVEVQEGASLYYHPCAVIPFAGSSFDSDMQVRLTAESEFAYSDIVTAGRIGMGEEFAFRRYRSRVCVSIGDVPVWLDHCLLEPKRMGLDKMLFFDGYTHQGTFYYYGTKDRMERLAGYETNLEVLYGVTHAAEGICVRVLAHTAQDVEEMFAEIAEQLDLTR